MPVKIPRETYESQINNIPNIMFVHWVGSFHGGKTLTRCKCLIDGFEWNVPHSPLRRPVELFGECDRFHQAVKHLFQ